MFNVICRRAQTRRPRPGPFRMSSTSVSPQGAPYGRGRAQLGLHPRAQDLSLHSVWDAMRSLQTPIVPGLYARGITWKPFGHKISRPLCLVSIRRIIGLA